ncbi:MAG: hypothetical protein MUO62_03795, partial [Anaerolineales bacterium]|nr:hypothetical protein [Anaerolineales bacterium]
MKNKCIFPILILVFILSACSQKGPSKSPPSDETLGQGPVQILTVMTHDSFAVSVEVIEVFQKEHNIE